MTFGTIENSFIAATVVAGFSAAVLLLMFLIPHLANALVSSEKTLMSYGYRRAQLTLWSGLSLLALTVVTAAQFSDSGFYIRFDGQEFQYGVWIGYAGVFLAHTCVAASYLGLSLSTGFAAAVLATASAVLMLFSGLSSGTTYIYWMVFAYVLGALALFLLIVFRHAERRRFFPHTLYIILACVAYGFLSVVFLVSQQTTGWAGTTDTFILYAVATCVLSVFFFYPIITYEPMQLADYVDVPTQEAMGKPIKAN